MSEGETPSALLAETVLRRLEQAGLCRPGRHDVLLVKIGTGRMSAADWRNEIDLAGLKENDA